MLKVKNQCQLFITSHFKGLLLNPQLHVNVLLPKLLNQLVILLVHQFMMTPLLVTLSIPHMK